MPIIGSLASGSVKGWGGLLNFNMTSSYESIQTVTVGSGGQGTIVFSSIPSTYINLQVRALNIANGSYVDVILNGDTGGNYTYQQLEVSTPQVPTAGGGSGLNRIYTNQTSTVSFPSVGIIDIYNYSSSSANKTVRLLSSTISTSGGLLYMRSGIWVDVAAINQVTFRAQPSSTFAQGTVYALYGMKGA
jgi:hypothetical protein